MNTVTNQDPKPAMSLSDYEALAHQMRAEVMAEMMTGLGRFVKRLVLATWAFVTLRPRSLGRAA